MSESESSELTTHDEKREADTSPSSRIATDPWSDPEITEPAVQLPLLQVGFSLSQGPIPSPDVMREYGQIDPSIIESIMEDFQRRSAEAVRESEHRRRIEERFIAIEEEEQRLRIAESQHSRRVGERSSKFTPYYIFGSLLLLALVAIGSPLDGWALASTLSAAFVSGTVILALAILRGPVSEEEGKTITSVAGSMSRREKADDPSTGRELSQPDTE